MELSSRHLAATAPTTIAPALPPQPTAAASMAAAAGHGVPEGDRTAPDFSPAAAGGAPAAYLGLGSNRRCATSSSNCATREAGQVIKNFDSLQVR